jgi:hypothetical protein
VNRRFRIPFMPAIAISFGLVVLLGYFLEIPLLTGLRDVFLRYALILAAVALVVGVANLASAHWRRIKTGMVNSEYSLVLLIALAITFSLAVILGPTDAWVSLIFNNILVPIEISLMAVLAVILVYASARVLHRRMNAYILIFLFTVIFILVITAPIPGLDLPFLAQVRAFISGVLAAAGARGLLLGVALGSIATGLRVLMGVDRPYGE